MLNCFHLYEPLIKIVAKSLSKLQKFSTFSNILASGWNRAALFQQRALHIVYINNDPFFQEKMLAK